ncbi:tetratricopeptide repeat protein [Azospirillum sp.]|uniref:tetratricopeptide repeat protein n=1 Tax=Azospirillum sp. TaxID=34012 RepID=UPI002D743CEE|nr:tetratricopeptide repeat protein [Azospirillum sp.]HYD69942.1 tetratricopeptide repeat protein [Azospirillum sp.]
METIEQALAIATAHHKAGRTAEAERIYREILERAPRQPDALHLLGVLALQGGRPDEAARLIGEAVAADGETPLFHANLGHALHAGGRHGEAALSFARALVRTLRHAEGGGKEGGNNVNALATLIRRYDNETRQAAVRVVEEAGVPADALRRHSLLFHLGGDVRHYRDLAATLLRDPQRFTVPALHHAYWGMAMQLFLGDACTGDAGAFMAGEFRRLYDVLVEETALRYGVAARLMPAGARNAVTRVALVTNQMLGDGHQPTLDAFDYARRLQDDFGREVLVVNANAMATEGEAGFIPAFAYNVTEEYRGLQTIEARGARIRMASFPQRSFDQDKVAAVVDAVERFDPDAVVAFGASNVIADLFAATRPVVCVPTSSGLPHTQAHLVLAYDGADDAAGWPADLRERFRPFAFGWNPPPTGETPPRGAYGLPAEGALFVVVGNRLDHEVDGVFLGLIDGLLDRLPDACVAFAGGVERLPGRVEALRNAARVRCLGHVDDIRALYRVATAALNPPRQGGGGSVAFALAEGLPVVTQGVGDGARVAGPAFTVADAAGFAGRCAALAGDEAFRTGQAEAARDRFAGIGDRHRSVERLLACCLEAQALV